MADLFAPPSKEELDLFAPPSKEENDLFAPVTSEEKQLYAPPSSAELSDIPPNSVNPEPGMLEAALRGGAQGALFEFADEAEAGARSVLQGRDYDAELKRIRSEYEAAESAYPGVSLGANLTGAIGASFIPGLGAIGNVAKGARAAKVVGAAALQGGLTELGKSEKTDLGDTALDVAKGAALGGTLGGVLHKVGEKAPAILGGLKRMFKSPQAASPEVDILRLAEEASSKTLEADTALGRKLYQGGELGPGDLDKADEFAYYLNNPSTVSPESSKLSPQKAAEVLDQRRAQMSEEDFVRSYQNYRELQNFKAVNSGIIRKEPGIKENLREGLNTVIDGTFAARDIDMRTGTNLAGALLDGTEKINKYQIDLARWIKAKQGIEEFGPEESKAIYEALDTGNISKLPAGLRSAAESWKSFYSDAADYAKALGVPIQKMDNYVPKKMVGMPEAIVKIKSLVEKLGGEEAIARNLGRNDLPGQRDLEKAVAYFNGGKDLSVDPGEFLKKLHEMQQPGSDAFLKEKVASALFRREDLLPDFLQEKDLRKLSNSWLMESLRYGHMRGTLDELSRQRDLLKVAGAEKDVEWIDNLVNDYLGGARGLAKVTRNGMAYLQVKALEGAATAKPGSLASRVYQTAADTPDALQNLVLNVYPNFLGLSPRAMVQNIVGGFYTMMPELGLTYGAQRGLDAYGRAIKNIAKDRKAYFRAMEESGFIAPQWTTDLKDALYSGKTPTGAKKVVKKGLDWTSDIAMKGFDASEKINRAVAWETGKLLTRDLLAGAGKNYNSAANFANTMPPGIKKNLDSLLAKGDAPAVEKLITKYFADRTLFSYNRLTQAELARAAGPLFSMFTKFPAAVLGNVTSKYREHGALEGSGQITKKLIAPYLAGSLLNELIFEEDSGVEKYLFGEPPTNKRLGTGIASASPMGAITSIAGGRVFTPPVVGTAKELSSAILEGDEERLARWAKGTATAFAPGGLAAYYKVLKQHAELAGLIEEDE